MRDETFGQEVHPNVKNINSKGVLDVVGGFAFGVFAAIMWIIFS